MALTMDALDITESYDEDGRPYLTVKSPKFKSEFTISVIKNGYSFYRISIAKGVVAQELSGSYTSMNKALKDLSAYINKTKETKTIKRDKFAEEREKRKANA